MIKEAVINQDFFLPFFFVEGGFIEDIRGNKVELRSR